MTSENDKARNETDDYTVKISKEALETQGEKPAVSTLEEALSLLKQKEEEARGDYDRMLRAAAELENYKKRAEREKSEQIKYANEMFVKALLPVLDNLERALEHARNDSSDKQALLEGVEMILKEFISVTEKFGLQAVDTSSRIFDPQHHEAVMVESNDTLEDNTIVNELQRGYLFQDRLLRPAMVVVSKRSSEI